MSADPSRWVWAAESALFDTDNNGIAVRERRLVAAFAAALTDPSGVYAAELAGDLDPADAALVDDLVTSAAQDGPWGTYREPDLAEESQPGTWWRLPAEVADRVHDPLASILEHAHLVLLHPRDARPDALEALTASGWDRPAIVTWSQLIAFVAFQARLTAGLAALSATEEAA